MDKETAKKISVRMGYVIGGIVIIWRAINAINGHGNVLVSGIFGAAGFAIPYLFGAAYFRIQHGINILSDD